MDTNTPRHRRRLPGNRRVFPRYEVGQEPKSAVPKMDHNGLADTTGEGSEQRSMLERTDFFLLSVTVLT